MMIPKNVEMMAWLLFSRFGYPGITLVISGRGQWADARREAVHCIALGVIFHDTGTYNP
jgi:hypothetical protein